MLLHRRPWCLQPTIPGLGTLDDLCLCFFVSKRRVLVHHLPQDVGNETAAVVGVEDASSRISEANMFHRGPLFLPDLVLDASKAIITPKTVHFSTGCVQVQRVVLHRPILRQDPDGNNVFHGPLTGRKLTVPINIHGLMKTKPCPLQDREGKTHSVVIKRVKRVKRV